MTSISQRLQPVTPDTPMEIGVAGALGAGAAFGITRVVAPTTAVHGNKKAWADIAKAGHEMDKLAITKNLHNTQIVALEHRFQELWNARDMTVAREANPSLLRKYALPVAAAVAAFAGAAYVMNKFD